MMGVRGPRPRGAWRGGGGDEEEASGYCSLLQFPDEILRRIIDWLRDHKDRNAVSRVCRRLHAIEGTSRQAVFISNCYAVRPMTLASRFPNARSITIKGKPRMVDFSFIPHADKWGAFFAPWVEVLATFYWPLRHLVLKRMRVSDDDIERLVGACGESLQRLELPKCSGFSTRGLDMVARGCRNLVVLNLSEADIQNEGAPLWLTTVANTALSLDVLDLSLTELQNVEQDAVLELAARCHTLKFCESLKIDELLPFLEAAQKTARHLGIGLYSQNAEPIDQIAEAFSKCKDLEALSVLSDLDALHMVMPIASRIKKLDLTFTVLGQENFADLLGACVNLESLQCTDIIGDRGLRQVGNCCKHLKTLLLETFDAGFVTQHGLISVARQCFSLECITFFASDMTNEALEILATNCPNLCDVRICLCQKSNDAHPVIELEAPDATLDLGLKHLLTKCPLLRRLSLGFDGWHRNGTNIVVTDVGMAYIGQYGQSLQIITLDHVNGTTDDGLSAIAFGCLNLRKIELRCCPYGDESMAAFVIAAPSLKLLWAQGCLVELAGVKMLAQRSDMIVEVVKQSAGDYADWQFIAYSTACGARADVPENVDLVHEGYHAPLFSGAVATAAAEGEGSENVVQDFEDVQEDRRFYETSHDCIDTDCTDSYTDTAYS